MKSICAALTRLTLLLVTLIGLNLPAFAALPDFGAPTYAVSAYNYKNITTDATFAAIKSGAGILHTICINTPAATETITVYDSLTATGTKIATITLYASTNPCFTYDANFTTGLTIVTATAAGDLTVSWL
jgi:hypothetical protein